MQYATQIKLIHRLFSEADRLEMPLWLGGGWAIDAKINQITREHEDIDLVYPADRATEFLSLLSSLGGKILEQTSYGFLATLNGIVIDCEPCIRVGNRYEIEGVPPGSCPLEPTGYLGGKQLRCTSWEAILWDYFYYLEEIPQSEWRSQDFSSFALAKASFGEAATQELHEQFKRQYEG